MRKITLVAFLLLSITALAVPKTATQLLGEAKAAREKVMKADRAQIATELSKLDLSIKAAVKEHKKISSPTLESAEEQVLYVSYSMEPAIALAKNKKPSKAACEKAKHKVTLEDKGSKPEDTPLSPEAQEAMEWIDLLCR